VYDGKISEDRVIEKPAPVSADAQTEEIHTTKRLNFKNTLHIGVLNYKSRPKFTLMMTFALFVCAITCFSVISMFGQSLIQPTMTTLDNTGVEGKVILSNRENDITQEQRRHRGLNKALSEQRDDEKHRYRAHKQRECHHKREFWAALVVEHADM